VAQYTGQRSRAAGEDEIKLSEPSLLPVGPWRCLGAQNCIAVKCLRIDRAGRKCDRDFVWSGPDRSSGRGSVAKAGPLHHCNPLSQEPKCRSAGHIGPAPFT
jgi:hypothetical protein